MSYPPPPGLKTPATHPPTSKTPQPHSSLPPRPPPSAVSSSSSSFKPAFSAAPVPAHPAPGVGGYGSAKPASSSTGYSAFTAFAPRSVANAGFRSNTATPPSYSASPQLNYSSTAQTDTPPAASYGPSTYGNQGYNNSSAPTIQNPFAPPSQGGSNGYGGQYSNYDPDMEAQIAQWQSAYGTKDETSKPGPRKEGATPSATSSIGPSRSDNSTPEGKPGKTVVRSGGGQTWQDSTLLEWDPAHFRLFVGNLAGEVTDDSLLKAFAKYPSVQKARVIRDKSTTKSKGYGFVSFSDGDEYFLAAREMQGKYIGSHPVQLKRSTTEIRPTAFNQKGHGKGGKGHHGKGGGGGHGPGGGKVLHGGIEKKQAKTKGGLKILG